MTSRLILGSILELQNYDIELELYDYHVTLVLLLNNYKINK